MYKPMLNVMLVLGLLFSATQGSARADNDVVSVKRLTMDTAVEVAQKAVHACRKAGYQVAAVVVDRNANVQAVMRDTLASRFTIQIAEEKANTVILSGTDSAGFRKARTDIKDEMNEVNGITLLEGGLPIRAAGTIVAAVGVSGAPGGELDAGCAQKGIDAVQERLEFAD